MNREEKLLLLQLVYRRWLVEFPGEEMDQIDCHSPLMQAGLGLPICSKFHHLHYISGGIWIG